MAGVLSGAFDTCVWAVNMVTEVCNGRRLGYLCMGGKDGDRDF